MAVDIYEIHQVEREDLNEGWIWLRNKRLRDRIENRRPALLVKDETSGRKVCCEILYADETYLHNRRNWISEDNQNNLLFLSAWYRQRLGIEGEAGPLRRFDVRVTGNFFRTIWWQLRACARHPQIAVVLSTVLAIVGTGLGILGAAAIFKDTHWIIWYVLGPVGLVITLLGFMPLVLRARN